MAADIYPAADLESERRIEPRYWVKLDSDGYYYHLLQYFQSAKLPPKEMLIDLNRDSEIFGYELDRLQKQLLDARMDIQWRPENWPVPIGWRGKPFSEETEIHSVVNKHQLIAVVEKLLGIIEYAKSQSFKVCVRTDQEK